MAKRILIGGGSGFIGRNLDRFLTSLGHEVTLISRKPAPRSITWSDVESSGIPEADAVVQLSGAPILDAPWTEARQKELLSSRVDLTKLLVEAISKSRSPPKVFIAGSAVGIYPSTIGRQFNEESKEVANNFPGKLVQRWEESAALPASIKNITRLVHMRTGVVLAPEGGALEKNGDAFQVVCGRANCKRQAENSVDPHQGYGQAASACNREHPAYGPVKRSLAERRFPARICNCPRENLA